MKELQVFKAEFFKALGHPLRIKILEILAEEAKTVNEIQILVNSEGSAVSQQLAILRSKNIVESIKFGNKVQYSLRDPLIIELLAVAKKIFNNHLINTINMLNEYSDKDD